MKKIITQKAMNYIEITIQTTTSPLGNFCVPVMHPITGEAITNYKKLVKYPEIREVGKTAFGKEWGT